MEAIIVLTSVELTREQLFPNILLFWRTYNIQLRQILGVFPYLTYGQGSISINASST